MKLTNFTCLVALFLSVSAFSAPVPSSDLDKVNQYIDQLIKQDNPVEDVVVLVTDAQKTKEGKLSSISVEAVYEKEVEIESYISLQKEIELGLIVSGNIKKYVEREGFAQQFNSLVLIGQQYVKAINKVGLYEATLGSSMSADKATVDFKIVPASEDAESINVVEVNVEVDMKTGDVTGMFSVNLNAAAKLVSKGQTAITNIFNSLLSSEEPKEEDFELLESVYVEVLKNVDASMGE